MASGINVEMQPWLDTFSGDLRYSLNRFSGDGIKTSWELQFAGGYIDQAHVKAYKVNMLTAEKTNLAFTWTGPHTVNITPAVEAGMRLVVYRDTPKATPLVNFVDGAIFNANNIDKVATQAVFAAAEMVDTAGEAVDAAVEAAGLAGAVVGTAADAVASAAASAVTAGLQATAASGHAVTAAAEADAAAISAAAAAASATGEAAVAAHVALTDPHPGKYAAAAHAHIGTYEPVDATILRTANIGVAVQAYDADTAKTDVAQNFTVPQRSAILTDNDGSFDLSAKQNFKCTTAAGLTLTFANQADGISGSVVFINGGNHAVAAHANTKLLTADLAKLSVTGTYRIDYLSDGTNVYCSVIGAYP